MAVQRLLLLSVSAGAGHVRAAEALKATAALRHPELSVTHVDVMDLVGRLFRQLYAKTYVSLVERQPALWHYLYDKTDQQTAESLLRQMQLTFERLNTRRFFGALSEARPDAIICTHFLPAQLLSRLLRLKKIAVPVWVQVTDFDVHNLWLFPNLTGYFAGNEEVAWRMQDRGIASDRIRVTGIPVMPAFATPPERAACRAELGLRDDQPTLLLMAGGAGIGSLEVLAERLLRLPRPCQILALAGRNAELLAALRQLAERFPGRLFPSPFTSTPERYMQASDLVLTKSGGLTTSECLALGRPMVVVSPIPGQEERNADYLLENGAALKACDAAALAFRVAQLLAEPARLQAMAAAARRLGRPQAAAAVLDRVLTAPVTG